jgi:hypothetical protein
MAIPYKEPKNVLNQRYPKQCNVGQLERIDNRIATYDLV